MMRIRYYLEGFWSVRPVKFTVFKYKKTYYLVKNSKLNLNDRRFTSKNKVFTIKNKKGETVKQLKQKVLEKIRKLGD